MPKDITLTETRRTLRNDATFAERILWYSLRGSQLDGRKFTRQMGIGPYIVDFYCPEEKLVIELDGSVHDEPLVKERDIAREAFLKGNGLTILRFTNDEFLQSGDSVIARIRETWKGRERNPIVRGDRSRKTRAPKNSTP
jgi:very-short-patch-repair endonuclease